MEGYIPRISAGSRYVRFQCSNGTARYHSEDYLPAGSKDAIKQVSASIKFFVLLLMEMQRALCGDLSTMFDSSTRRISKWNDYYLRYICAPQRPVHPVDTCVLPPHTSHFAFICGSATSTRSTIYSPPSPKTPAPLSFVPNSAQHVPIYRSISGGRVTST